MNNKYFDDHGNIIFTPKFQIAPGVKRNRMSKMKLNNFFSELAVNMNTTDVNLAKISYYGLVKMVMKSLNSVYERCDLPDFGYFKVVHFKSRYRYSAPLKEKKWLGASKSFKFIPNKKIRMIFNGKTEWNNSDNP